MPISFFKTQSVKTGRWEPKTIFYSSSTTGGSPSKHEIKSLRFYHNHARKCFEHFFGSVLNYHFFALLPSYIERGNSSLISMIDFFIKESKSSYSGFYSTNMEKLLSDIKAVQQNQDRKIIIWGVSFALLDLAEKFNLDLSQCLIFETGGMKGRRKEITRQELHNVLKNAFQVDRVYSEYGMTELFSQAYTRGASEFVAPPWMKILIRQIGDPFSFASHNTPGVVNIIDLANMDSIAFIETEDIGVLFEDGTFEIRGRLDNSDIRGCNLMIE